MNSELAQQISEIDPGGHLCLFYDRDPAEQLPALIPFIQAGLDNGEQFIYISDDHKGDELADRLQRCGIDVTEACSCGALKLWTRREWRLPGELSPAKKLEHVRQLIKDASVAGFKGIRFAIEMTWTLGPDIEADQLERWEATLNTLFEPSFPGRMICQYNRSRLAPEVLLAALHTHPQLVLGEHVYPNHFYQAPFILSQIGSQNGNGHDNGNGKDTSARVEWMVSELQRARAVEKERGKLIHDRAVFEEHERSAEGARRLAAIVDSSDDAIISKDLNGVIRSWNQGAERIFGYTAAEAIGRPITMLLPPERQDEEPGILDRIRRGERIDHYETVRRRKDGALIDISLTVSPIKDSRDRVIGASKIARDITDRRRREAELREARLQLAKANSELEKRVEERTASLREAIAQIEEFSYSVSHDLRSPVRAMKGYAETVLEDYGGGLDEQARDYLNRIVRGGARMDRLIQDVLTYSRLSRGEMQLHPVSLNKLVHDILQQYPEMQPPRSEIAVQEPLPSVMAHEPSLAQIISNLLANAVKFVPPGETPRVKVHAENGGARVRLWVEDNGIGIKPEHQNRLFGVFQRIHSEKAYEGTGIGLAIVRKGIERMGGTVGVHSDGLTGSQFWIELPAAKTHE